MIEVVRYDTTRTSEWDAFVSKSKNGTFILCRVFMDYHKDRFSDHSLMIYYNYKLLAVVPAHEQNQILYAHQGLTYGGVVWHKKVKFVQAF